MNNKTILIASLIVVTVLAFSGFNSAESMIVYPGYTEPITHTIPVINMENVVFIDDFGVPVYKINQDQSIQLKVTLTNISSESQYFIWFIKNDIEMWLAGEIAAGQTITSSMGIPTDKVGTFDYTLNVYDKNTMKIPLAEPITGTYTVESPVEPLWNFNSAGIVGSNDDPVKKSLIKYDFDYTGTNFMCSLSVYFLVEEDSRISQPVKDQYMGKYVLIGDRTFFYCNEDPIRETHLIEGDNVTFKLDVAEEFFSNKSAPLTVIDVKDYTIQ